MIMITDAATNEVTRYFESRESSPIRIFYNAGG